MRKYSVIFFLTFLGNLAIASESSPSVHFYSETRETDYTIGDIATQKLVVTVPKGYQLDEGSIPEKAKTEAIELRHIQWGVEHDNDSTRYRFTIDWQIFVAFETVKSIPLRNLELIFRKNDNSIKVSVPPDNILVSNLLPPKMDAKHVQPYPDEAPKPIQTSKLWLGFMLSGVILFFSSAYIAWFIGWIRLPFEKNMPFRQAWRQIKSLPQDDIASVSVALKTLSKAISGFAGYAVTSENLPRLSAEKTLLAPYLAELNTFYHALQAVFFEGSNPTIALNDIMALSKKLSHLEIS